MPIPEDEMIRRCGEVFGEPLDAARRTTLAGILDTVDRTNLEIVSLLENHSEPMGHVALLKSSRRDE